MRIYFHSKGDNTLKSFIKTTFQLFFGYFLYGLAIVFMLNANIGLSPWDAFHQGLSIKTGITVGQACIFAGTIIVILDAILGESVGWGTITNMIFVGVFVDTINMLNIVPHSNNFFIGLIMLLIGLILAAVATVVYLSVGLGSGPRDGLMLALHKKTNLPIKIIRAIIELFALFLGWLLGGTIGIGTVINALFLGYAIQIGFSIIKINPKDIKHKSITSDLYVVKKFIFANIINKNTNDNNSDEK